MGTVKKELPLARSMCWHCQSDIGGEYFCNQCVKVQPLSKDMDYFTCFGLPRKLNVDTAQLQTKFYELSRVFHPDFFEGKSEMERAVCLAQIFQIWDKLVERHAHDQAQTAAEERTLKEMRDLLSERTYVTNMLQNLTEALA